MKKNTLILIAAFLSFSITSCVSETNTKTGEFSYPVSKIWKHGVYSKYDAEKYSETFDGLEVDLVYSKKYNNIFIGRQEDDAEKSNTFDEWLSMVKRPNNTRFWIDFKNLSTENAEVALECLDKILNKHNARKQNFMIESQDINTLKIVKKFDYYIILWVDNIYWWKSHTHTDSISVCKTIRHKINDLRPDAISCEYTAYPLLCDSFPNQNIHFWDTPKEFSDDNIKFTQELCHRENVRVVLVDYPQPIEY